MQYFDDSEDNLERIGHVIGDAIALAVYLTVLVLMAARFY
jgi:hypothetical protein